jgi:cytochrome c556
MPEEMMNRGGRLLVIAIAAAAAFAGSVVSQELREQPDVAALSADEVVKLRNDIMKEDGEILIKAFRAGGEEGIEGAKHLIHNVTILKTLFPEGSITDASHALPTIWAAGEKEKFEALFDAVAAKAQEAADAEAAGDNAGFKAAMQAASKLCGDCHTVWRAPLS